jgi:RHH-type rel operon transcriptional repressor/antitoxin RelB
MTISIQLPSDVESRFEQLANLTGRSKTFYVQETIVEYLDDLEDLNLAEHELEEIRAGRAKTTPLAEVMKRYGMED